MGPIQLAFLLFTACQTFLSSLTVCDTRSFWHVRSNWSSVFFSSTTFKIFPDISDLLSEESKFQHHTQPYSKYSTLPVSSLNLSTICWWRYSASSCLMQLWNTLELNVTNVSACDSQRDFNVFSNSFILWNQTQSGTSLVPKRASSESSKSERHYEPCNKDQHHSTLAIR
jgi:hypothetical protein